MPHVLKLNPDATAIDLLESDPRYAGVLHLIRDWMRTPSELTVGERELIAAYVSALNDCAFCVGAHKALAESFGADPNMLNVLENPYDMDSPSRLRAALRLARMVTVTPRAICADSFEKAYEEGLSREAAESVIAISALFSMITRLVDGHGINLAPGSLDAVLKSLGPNGELTTAALV